MFKQSLQINQAITVMFKQSKYHLFIDCPQIKGLKNVSQIIEDAIIKMSKKTGKYTKYNI